jgi:DNA modification methylase
MEKNTPLKFIGEIIWSKKNPRGNGASEDKIRPKNKIEYIMTFAINPKKVKYKKLQYKKKDFKPTIATGFKDVSKNGKVKKPNKMLNKGYVTIKNHIYEQEVENIITTMCGENYDVSKIIKNGHPAIMSAMLPITIIQMYTDEGDLVYDCMAGSNVVGRASQLLNRKTISTELSPKYFNVGCKMLENAINEFNRDELNIINEISSTEESLSVAA